MAILLKGKPVAEQLDREISEFAGEHRITLAVIQIGNDPASTAYRKFKKKRAVKMGIHFEEYLFDVHVPPNEITDLLDRLNSREEITGIFMEQPVPEPFREYAFTERIMTEKDIDGITSDNAAALYFNREGLFPATAEAVMEILSFYKIDPRGKEAVVVGRSNVVGKPLAMMLTHAHATVTLCHSRTRDLEKVIARGEIVVAAVGKAGLISGERLREDAVVIDAGYNIVQGRTCGDVDFGPASEKAAMITPVPGGVGTVTNSVIFHNLIKAYKIQHGI